jgi:hypothetical protein
MMMSPEIIEVPYAVTWTVPVRVRVGNGFSETIGGPEEALHCLTYRWPAVGGNQFDTARLKCLRALQKQASCEEARDVFISAAIEARMLA